MKRKPIKRGKSQSGSLAVLIRWPADLLAEVDAAALREGVGRSQFVRSAALKAARAGLPHQP